VSFALDTKMIYRFHIRKKSCHFIIDYKSKKESQLKLRNFSNE